MAREEILEKGPKSRAFYRLQATKKLTGGGNLLKKKLEKPEPEKEESKETIRDDVCRIYFNPAHYTVMESVGQFAVTIVRSGDISALCVLTLRQKMAQRKPDLTTNHWQGLLSSVRRSSTASLHNSH
ncbi:hypothetical protein CEXT_654701 [Caerostris extrusa]|uniref:Sodium/calcium exchanger domain-containing protein n=1 Tax=Caerostris extrusa TaxID=172846 RepID=A0AAV4V8S6_CAEEX|nr:hypothetical protein CEXT_654701 [Caerostris extrusa]